MEEDRSVAWFTGKLVAYERSLEVGKKLHMVGPIGNTGLLGRARAFQLSYGPYRGCREPVGMGQFRENPWPYRLLEVAKNSHMGWV